jgi:hypothetical protein
MTTLQLNTVLEGSAGASRTVFLNTSTGVSPNDDFNAYVEINVYVPTSNLNSVFTTSGAASTWMDLSADNGADYIAAAAAQQQVSGQPLDFHFDWTQLVGGPTNDLNTLHNNVFTNTISYTGDGSASGPNDGLGTNYEFTSEEDPAEITQSISPILKVAGRGLGADASIPFLGTVYSNLGGVGAIVNVGEFDFLRPIMTASLLYSDVLPMVNRADLDLWRQDVFVQAYNAYKYDSNYGRLDLSPGDKISIPVNYTVTQEVI